MTGIMSIAALAAMAARLMEKAEVNGSYWEGDMSSKNLTSADIADRRRASAQTCNISLEEQAERDRQKSRQERRQMERLRRKGRS